MSESKSRSITSDLIEAIRLVIRPYARGGEDVDDILQEVLLKIMKHGDAIEDETFFGWVQTAARTTAIDMHRKARKNVGASELEPASSEESDSDASASLAKCLRGLVAKLDPEDAEVIVAIDFDGKSQKQLAEKIGAGYSATKSKVQRARKKLKEEILRCCSVELDRRSRPIDFRTHKKSDCC